MWHLEPELGTLINESYGRGWTPDQVRSIAGEIVGRVFHGHVSIPVMEFLLSLITVYLYIHRTWENAPHRTYSGAQYCLLLERLNKPCRISMSSPRGCHVNFNVMLST